MRTVMLSSLLIGAISAASAHPAAAQQGWSRQHSAVAEQSTATRGSHGSPDRNTGKQRADLEAVKQRLRQQDRQSTVAAELSDTPTPRTVSYSAITPDPSAVNASGIQQAHLEVSEVLDVSTVPENKEVKSDSPAARPFLDLTHPEASDSDSALDSSAGRPSSGGDVSLASSPIEVLQRAVAWIVVALCLGSLVVLGVRRWQRHRGLLPTSNSQCRVLATLSLGPGRTVSLIEMPGCRALVASDSGGIRSLGLVPADFHSELMAANAGLINDQ